MNLCADTEKDSRLLQAMKQPWSLSNAELIVAKKWPIAE